MSEAVVAEEVWHEEAVGATVMLVLAGDVADGGELVSTVAEAEDGDKGSHHHHVVGWLGTGLHAVANLVENDQRGAAEAAERVR